MTDEINLMMCYEPREFDRILEHFSRASLVSRLISSPILSAGLLKGPLYHGSGSVSQSDDDGGRLTRVYFYSERICIMHAALTKHPLRWGVIWRVTWALFLSGMAYRIPGGPASSVYTCKYCRLRACAHKHMTADRRTEIQMEGGILLFRCL